MANNQVKRGSRVTVHTTSHNGTPATVRFIGQVSGKAGDWLGLELDTPQGSNNGTIGNVKYFECQDNYGLFVRPQQVKTLIKNIRKKPNPEESKAEEESKEKAKPRNLQERKEELDQKRQEKSRIREGMGNLRKEEESMKSALDRKEQELIKVTEELTQKNLQISQDAVTIKTLQEKVATLEAAPKELDDSTKELIETLTLEKEHYEENTESLKSQIEELQERVQSLEEDLELKTLEIEEIQEQSMGDVSELDKSELQQAVRKLYNDNQAQKQYYEEQIYLLENQLGNMPELESKLKQIPELKQEIQQREGQIAELKEALEQTSTYNDMIEQLTEDNLKLEKKITTLTERKDELEEMLELEEQFAEDQAEIEKALNDEIANQEYEISQLKNDILQREEAKSEYERTLNQYRIKLCDMQNDMEVLKDQLADSGEQEKMKKINDLISKNLALGNKIRAMVSSDINGKVSEIENRLLERKMQYLSEAIPNDLLEQLDFNAFNNLNSLTLTKTKSYLLARELIIHSIDVRGDKSLVKWVNVVISLCMQNFTNISMLEDHIFGSTFEEYQELVKKMDWGQISNISSSIDLYLAKLKEGGLSPNIAVDSFKLSSQEIQNLRESEIPQDSVATDLVKNLVLTALGVYSLYHIYDFDVSIFAGIDYKDLYQKALTISYKMQFINMEEDSQAMRNFCELLAARYNAVSSLLNSDGDISASTYDWTAWSEHTERDLKNITLLPSYKKPTSKTINPPWIVLAHEVRSKLAKFEETVKELEETQNNLKLYSVNLGKAEKELNDAKIAKKNLEMRLKDANAKSQRLSQMEVEKKRLQDREKYFEESLEALNVEMEKLQQNNKLLQEELSHVLSDAENSKIRRGSTNISEVSNNTPAGNNSLTILRPTPPVGQDELEAFRAIIDLYSHEKREGNCSYIRNLVRSLPKFDGIPEDARKDLNKAVECKKLMISEISKMKMVDLKDPEHVQKFHAQRENLDSIRATARQVFAGLPKSYSHEKALPVGTIAAGQTQNTVSAEVGLFELKQIQKLIRI